MSDDKKKDAKAKDGKQKDAKQKGAAPKAEAKKAKGKGKGKDEAASGSGAAVGTIEPPNRMPRVREHYEKSVRPELMKRFSYRNQMQAPRLTKIVVNMGVGDALVNIKFLEQAVVEMATITGQRPSIRRSKKSIANFKLREGQPVGCMVTLRGARMYEFYDRLVNVALPRIRDFRGVPQRSFDGQGNYSLGLSEQIIFPEINYDRVEKVRGMDITFVTSARTDEEGQELLRLLNMPFRQR